MFQKLGKQNDINLMETKSLSWDKKQGKHINWDSEKQTTHEYDAAISAADGVYVVSRISTAISFSNLSAWFTNIVTAS